LTVVCTVISGKGVAIEPGNAMALKDVPLGAEIHAIEMQLVKVRLWQEAQALMLSWLEKKKNMQ
jgi:ribosomal protein L2